MTEQIVTSISREEEATELNLQQLYELGLAHIRELSHHLWTDYNVHDPGITLLEVLCYALTDLGYRASMPMADLLATATDNRANMAAQFFSARQILPARALTERDYRKLLIDLAGVKNAWLQPYPLTYYADLPHARLRREDPATPAVQAVSVRGLYRVLIDYMDDLSAEQRDDTLARVRATLHANRNLCEDFVAIEAVEEQAFIVCAELELTPDADPETVNADILYRLQDYLAPAVRNYSLAEMLQRRHPDGRAFGVDEIFNGPALECGFIPDDELARGDLKTELRLSDAINIVMDVPGVVAVRELLLNQRDAAAVADKWRLPVRPGHKPQLDIGACRLVCFKGVMPVPVDAARVALAVQARMAAARRKLESVRRDDLAIPEGRFRDPGDYYSVQHHLPAVYGLGDAGLPAGADSARRAQALQLRAYLLFCEQLLANYCTQLAHLGELFSSDEQVQRTNFYQLVDSFRDWEKVYAPADPAAALNAQLEDAALGPARRQRFLDHLIGRFAEQFSDYARVMASAFNLSDTSLRRHKCRFLQHYPEVSAGRGMAYNYALRGDADLWNSDNISGLERRLGHLLDIRNVRRRNLSEVAHDIYAEVDATPDDEFRFRVRHRVSGDILLSSSTRYPRESDALAEMYIAIRLASGDAGYQRKVASDGRHYFNIVDADGEVVARRIEYFDSPAVMASAIDELIDYLQAHYNDEGLYVIENLLLRPQQADDPMLPICVDSQCPDCSELDPYSYRLHIILPAYGARFIKPEFRRFAESVIRTEVPAHILPKVCWIDQPDMAALEGFYRRWISLQAGRAHANRASVLRNFIRRLFAVRNVYPSEQLGDCQDDDKFILAHTALGSFDPGARDA